MLHKYENIEYMHFNGRIFYVPEQDIFSKIKHWCSEPLEAGVRPEMNGIAG
jgi:hypothetical protein